MQQGRAKMKLGVGIVLALLLTVSWLSIAGATTCNIYDSSGTLLDSYTLGGSGLQLSSDGNTMSIYTTYSSGGGGGGTTYSISGNVSGLPSGTSVTLTLSGSASKATTVPNGSFAFTGLANGTYTITPQSVANYNVSPTSISNISVNGANVSGKNFVYSSTGGGGGGGTTGDPAGTITLSAGDSCSVTLIPGAVQYFKFTQATVCQSTYKQLRVQLVTMSTSGDGNLLVKSSNQGNASWVTVDDYNYEFGLWGWNPGTDWTRDPNGGVYFWAFNNGGSGEIIGIKSSYSGHTWNQADTYYVLLVNDGSITNTYKVSYSCI